MIRYTPASAAHELSQALWNLTRPIYIRNEQDTDSMFNWVTDTNGQRWLEVHDDFSIIVHSNAELGSIASILQPFIDSNQLSANTNSQLSALINSSRGQSLIIFDAFPQLFKDLSKTYEQMITDGLLTEPEIP